MFELDRRPHPADPRNRTFSRKPPQKQCKYHGGHDAHNFGGREGLIWSCQGKGVRL